VAPVVAGAEPPRPGATAPSPARPPSTEVAPTLRDAAAHLRINAEPWAHVTLDGRPLGETPLMDVEVEPGRHRLRFEHVPSEAIEERTIDVDPGEQRDIIVDLTARNRASPAPRSRATADAPAP
jgi:serine/threonine-protein kinase